MKIEYVQEYKKHGVNLKGDLAVVRLAKRMKEMSEGKPLGGFGSMSCYDAKDEAIALINEIHSWHQVVLGLPDLVVRVNPYEWETMHGTESDD